MIAPLFCWWAKITIRAEAKTVNRGGEMVSDTVGGPTLHAVRRAVTKVELAARARRSTADPTFRLANTNLHVAAGIYVQNIGAKTYHFRVSDNGTIVESASDNDVHDVARSAAIAYLKGYRRWFGHWIPIEPRPARP